MKRSDAGGFTIVETMIVLAVMGVLFVSMVGVVRGQQGKAQFRSAVTDFTTQLQSYISQVSTGYYPKNRPFTCTAPSGSVALKEVSTALDSKLGSNSDCTYMGQAVMLGIPGTDPEQYALHTLVGIRKTSSGGQPENLRAAGTQVMAKGSTYNTVSSWPDFASIQTLRFGSKIEWMRTKNGNRNIAGLAVVTSPTQELAFNKDNLLESGSIVPVILPILNPNGGSSYGVEQAAGVDLIVRSLGNVPAAQQLQSESYIGPIDICMSSGTTEQHALITIGSNSSTTSVDFVINNGSCP